MPGTIGDSLHSTVVPSLVAAGLFDPGWSAKACLRNDVTSSIILPVNTAAKLLLAMRRTSLDWQLAHLQTVARQYGIDWRHDGTSHRVFLRSDGKTLPVPAHRPIKPIYVKKFIELVDGE